MPDERSLTLRQADRACGQGSETVDERHPGTEQEHRKSQNKLRGGRGLLRAWVIGTIFWIAYLIWTYYVYCSPSKPPHIVCYWYPFDPSAAYITFSVSDILRLFVGVPVLGAVALKTAFWVFRSFRSSRPKPATLAAAVMRADLAPDQIEPSTRGEGERGP
jgi:hypothetical protein